MSVSELASHNVTAAFRDLERATEAIRALREADLDDDDLSVLGRPVDQGLDVPPERITGEPIGGEVAKQTAAGTAAGTAVGGALGALGTLAVASVPGVGLVAGTGALIGAIAGGGLGGTVGAIVEGESALRSSAGWAHTFQAIQDGAVVVGVHSEDPEVVSRGEEVLARLAPMDLTRVDHRGHRRDDAGEGEAGSAS